MSVSKAIFIALIVSLLVVAMSNRNRIPVVNPGKPLFKAAA